MKFLLLMQLCILTFAKDEAEETPEDDEVVPLIIGGHRAEENEFPFMVAVLEKYESDLILICTGFLTSPSVAVTAGHCFNEFKSLGDYILRIGDVDYRFGESYYLKKFLVPKEYSHGSSYGDIAIMVLDRPVTLPDMSFLRIPTREMSTVNFDGYSAIVLGWGRETAKGKTSNKLRYLDNLTIVPSWLCQQVMIRKDPKLQKKFYRGFEEVLCAGHRDFGKDSCKGDSGAPLIVNYYGYTYVIGSVSFGIGCALPNMPAVHMKLALYADAINDPDNRRNDHEFYTIQ